MRAGAACTALLLTAACLASRPDPLKERPLELRHDAWLPSDGAGPAHDAADFADRRLLPLPLGRVRPHGWLAGELRELADGCYGAGPLAQRFATPSAELLASDDGTLTRWLAGLEPLAALYEGAPARRAQLQALVAGWRAVSAAAPPAAVPIAAPRAAPLDDSAVLAALAAAEAWPLDPREELELAVQVDRLQAWQARLAQDGDVEWAARCEAVAFNLLPAYLAPDSRGACARSAANLLHSELDGLAPGSTGDGAPLLYSAGGAAQRGAADGAADGGALERAVAALGSGFTSYVRNAWMATRDGGVAALLHGPTVVHFDLDARRGASVEAQTTYPFDATIAFTIRLWSKVDSAPPSLRPDLDPARFPLWLRIPAWCRAPQLLVDGRPFAVDGGTTGFVRLERDWRHGDVVTLELPMEVAVRSLAESGGAPGSVAIERGPLRYSLDLGEQWRRASGAVEGGVRDEWPTREVVATRPWNFALQLDPEVAARAFDVVERADRFRAHPFVLPAPLELRAKGRRLVEWTLERGRCAPLQAGPVECRAPLEELRLVPMGSTRVRITAFPVVAALPGQGERWSAIRPLPRASQRSSTPFAPFDGIAPECSDDDAVARYSFDAHRGGIEWLEREFDETLTLTTSAVFWHEDAGRGPFRLPASWRLLWRDRNGSWQPVEPKGDYPLERDAFSRVAFAPVTTRALRLELVQPADASCALYEWTAE
ncbi:MAG: glycoside hydrolase family 127 protein [Planctomycetes bacterium]|nr:glycoside hydrolase family 127 protein [Planctomycetota bacterium]